MSRTSLLLAAGENVAWSLGSGTVPRRRALAQPQIITLQTDSWAEAHEKIARMTLTIKLDRNWSSFQLANSAPPLSVTDSAIAPSARMEEVEPSESE